jgi:hypothetical protein
MSRLSLLCSCGSDKKEEACCKKKLQVGTKMVQFPSPRDQQVFLMHLAISSEFDMRYRGLLEFYGNDLIAYKQEKHKDPARNEFLRILANYLTTILENHCPSSWQECQPPFWEEFIVNCIPHLMKITSEEKEVESILFQLKKFSRWLDKRIGTSCSKVIEVYSEEAKADLKVCERLLNQHPNLHLRDCDPHKEFEKAPKKISSKNNTIFSCFEITGINENNVVLTDIKTGKVYHIQNLPCELDTLGFFITGELRKKSNENAFESIVIDSVFPPKAKTYMKKFYIRRIITIKNYQILD